MGRQQYEQFCLRFSPDNPQHVKVLRILNNLDRDLYKSKTQFIMEAKDIILSYFYPDTPIARMMEIRRQYESAQ